MNYLNIQRWTFHLHHYNKRNPLKDMWVVCDLFVRGCNVSILIEKVRKHTHPYIYIHIYIYIYNYIYIDWYGFIHLSHWNIHHMINALFGNFSILFRYIPTNSGAIFRWSTKIGFDDYIEKVVVVFTTKFLRPYFVSCAKNFRFMIFPRPIH